MMETLVVSVGTNEPNPVPAATFGESCLTLLFDIIVAVMKLPSTMDIA